jgi:Rrf2 family protein
MISQTAEYCLRAVLCLATSGAEPRTTLQIARLTGIPPGYLCKILRSLSRAGLVSAQRGLNGGFVLQRDPASLTLLEVVRVADPSRRITECPLGIHGKDLCVLHRQLDNAMALAERALAGMTLAQLTAAPCPNPLSEALRAASCPSKGALCSLSGDVA